MLVTNDAQRLERRCIEEQAIGAPNGDREQSARGGFQWLAVERKWVNAGTDFGENFARFALHCCQVAHNAQVHRVECGGFASSRALFLAR
ncbi:hypothetical protein BG61_22585 [Caballeronia glathei]|uniref:Uncharacterized protein n=1 Tax=Caballeronia glathei TaxID=60547 RepID=A0A069PU57_9BURK|nr:hypothetical protein BG61_22585 [Caballeronia glathei]